MAEEKKWSEADGYFLELVSWLSKSCWVQLGKIADPITGEKNQNFKDAAVSIGMLDMLKKKTSGNLDEELGTILDKAISELRISFIEEKEKTDKGNRADRSADTSGKAE